MKVHKTQLPGVLLIEPRIFKDERGFFMESWHLSRYEALGIDSRFAQDNVSLSNRGVLRGLHYQNPKAQGKLAWVLEGEVFDVAVDVRKGSPTFGKWQGFQLSSENNHQLWIPPGFAHGFCVTSERALFSYKCSESYSPQDEMSVLYNDPEIGIQWPDLKFSLSEKDVKAAKLKDIPQDRLPKF
jgi:dTDP-4-dehydrorhamnose 3,5-epimerase